MAREKKPKRKKKAPTTVPVASRSADRAARKKAQAAQAAQSKTSDRLDLVTLGFLAIVTIILLLLVSVPLNNFYAGRAEIARLNESIVAKKAEKERLLAEIDKYESESYIEQEARRRLGVVKPGETAYRILDPGMSHDSAVTTDVDAVEDSREWYTVLWDSLATEAAPAPEPADAAPQAPQPPAPEPEAPAAE